MKKTNEQKCPNCGSLDIKDTGSRGPFRGNPKILPQRPAYFKCDNCEETFKIL